MARQRILVDIKLLGGLADLRHHGARRCVLLQSRSASQDTIVEVNDVLSPVDGASRRRSFYITYAVFSEYLREHAARSRRRIRRPTSPLRWICRGQGPVGRRGRSRSRRPRSSHQLHPDRRSTIPQVTVVDDDAACLRRPGEYDLVVSLIESLTMRVELPHPLELPVDHRIVRAFADRLDQQRLLVVYDCSALAGRFGSAIPPDGGVGADPRLHVHEARAYLRVMFAAGLGDAEPDPGAVGHGVQLRARPPHGAPLARRHIGRSDEAARRRLTLPTRPASAYHYLYALALILIVFIVAFLLGPPPAGRRLVVAVLPRRRLHAARTRRSSSSRSCGIRRSVGRVAGDRRRARHAFRRNASIVSIRSVAPHYIAAVLVGSHARRPGPSEPVALDSRMAESIFLHDPDVTFPDPVRPASVRLGDQTLDLAGAGTADLLGDGRRPRRVYCRCETGFDFC